MLNYPCLNHFNIFINFMALQTNYVIQLILYSNLSVYVVFLSFNLNLNLTLPPRPSQKKGIDNIEM